MPHQFHLEELELECDLCHEEANESVSLDVRILPEKDLCLECHDGDTAPDECSTCHFGDDDPQTYRELLPRSGPFFSHVFHLAKKPNCSDCHDYVYSDEGLAPPVRWSEKRCRECHQSSRPDYHTADWVSVHGIQVNHLTEQKCRVCHEQTFCDQCHQLQQFEPKVHPVSFILNHGFDARSGIMDCSSCHDVVRYCQTCHKQNSVMPMDHNLPDWVGTSIILEDGGLHSSAALDAVDVCQACHNPSSDRTCLRCHGK